MKKIIVGLSGAQLNFENTNFIKDYVNNHYSHSMMKLGATPIILPITTDNEILNNYIDLIDALILTGGDDINPKLYKEEFLSETQVPDDIRDEFENKLFTLALRKRIPILGICRGMQLINVYFGGSLYQDLKYNKKIKFKHEQGLKNPHIPVHKVILSESSFLEGIFEKEIWVNSFHHQGVKKLGSFLKISATSTDGLIEGIEYINDNHFILGVQWHPEMMYSNGDDKIMEKLFIKFLKQVRR